MEKNAITFIIISMMILIGWQYIFAPTPPAVKPPAQAVANSTSIGNATDTAVSAPPPLPSPTIPGETVPGAIPAKTQTADTKETELKVDTPLYSAVFSSRGGTLKSFVLKKHAGLDGRGADLLEDGGIYRTLAIGVGDDFSYSDAIFAVRGGDVELKEKGGSATVAFSFANDNYSIERVYTFHANSYGFDVSDDVRGLPAYWVTLGTDFGIQEKGGMYAHVGPVVLKDTDREEFVAKSVKEPETLTGGIKWIAIEDKYFFSAIVPETPMDSAVVWKSMDSAAVALKGKAGLNRIKVFAGPKIIDMLESTGTGLEHIVDFGFFSIVARPIFWLLKQIHTIVGNYGWSIVLLTIVIRIPFIPIVSKGQKSMKRMQDVQPKIQEIRERYKKDPDKMNKEIMALYSKYKVNPLGGCLPLLLQLPVFFALYKVLLVSIELRGAPWALWITDLSMKDPFYVLPIVMGISMFVQQKLTPAAGDPKQQKIMMFLPLIFTFMFLNFSSGLVLYWLTNNVLSIVQQVFVNKQKDVEPA